MFASAVKPRGTCIISLHKKQGNMKSGTWIGGGGEIDVELVSPATSVSRWGDDGGATEGDEIDVELVSPATSVSRWGDAGGATEGGAVGDARGATGAEVFRLTADICSETAAV
jgi:hypothetical protein